ncbi:GDSL esterase/lipase At5g55050-like [Coffea arabica]|uniref:GDSL esterase/lipase At5g55050-like n=1 Tax=Coffea arabica TaxID=13443 RepID=A0A6P6UF22_COFAR|nr:GDSL esterase/lipase At5g55050-like [Coffea arabica]
MKNRSSCNIVVLSYYLQATLALLVGLVMLQAALGSAAKPPAIFILGDSTVDVGTNSYLQESRARADFPHYGIDFPRSRPTGRFSNGLNGADFLARLMGYNSSPRPFLSLGSPLLSYLRNHAFRGANFASAGSGLLDLTGSALGVVPLSEQIKQFATLQGNLSAVRGSGATEAMLQKSLFCISIGSNDLFDYVVSNSSTTPQEFIYLLMKEYENSIKTLYSLGARKFGIISVPPIGCCPTIRLLDAEGKCSEALNGLARAFYSALETLLYGIGSELEDMKYSLGNAYLMTINVIDNPQPFHFTRVDTACCGFGKLNAEQACNATANLCSKRKEYLFWDQFHPTQAAANLAANTLYAGPPLYVSPINFAQLVQL